MIRTYLNFSKDEENIDDIFKKCKRRSTRSLGLGGFYNAFFKSHVQVPKDKLQCGTFEFMDGSITSRQLKIDVSILCTDCNVHSVMGIMTTYSIAPGTTKIIYYDLGNFRKSVSKFTRETGLPEFFFWKTILKTNQDPLSSGSEQFGKDLFIDNHFSRINNYGTVYELRNEYFKCLEPEPEPLVSDDLVVVNDSKESQLQELLNQVEKIVKLLKKDQE